MNEHTPKHFVLQLGSLLSLYLSISFLLVLLFGLINLAFPDQAESYYNIESHASSVRIGIAMLIVFFPVYLYLTHAVNQIRRNQPDGMYLALTRWLIYLSLLVAGGALLIDVVIAIMTFLEGDLTSRFVLKVGAVLGVVGAAFYYYLLDARGYWLQNKQKSYAFGIGALLVVLISVVYGFGHIETPAEVREGRLDERQVQDLQLIQSEIEGYYYRNESLPTSLDEFGALPTAPEGRDAYRYGETEAGFELCASFVTDTQNQKTIPYRPTTEKDALILNPWDWEHPAGEYCFERIVNQPEPETTE